MVWNHLDQFVHAGSTTFIETCRTRTSKDEDQKKGIKKKKMCDEPFLRTRAREKNIHANRDKEKSVGKIWSVSQSSENNKTKSKFSDFLTLFRLGKDQDST